MNADNGDSLIGKYTPVIMLLVAFITAYLSFTGYDFMLNEVHRSFENTAKSLVIAIGSSMLIWLAWNWFFWAIKRCNTRNSLIAIVVLSFICQLGVTKVSTEPNTVGSGGKKVLIVHNLSEIERAETLMTNIEKANYSLLSLVHEIELHEAEFRALGEDEFKNGTETGSPGHGAVADSRIAIADRLKALMQQLTKASLQNEKLFGEARRLLEKMRLVIKTSDDPREAIELMAPYATEFSALLLKIEQRDVSGMITRSLALLPRQIDMRERYSRNAETRERQKRSIAAIRAALEDTTTMINLYLKGLDVLKSDASFTLERITAQEGIYKHFWAIGSIWAANLVIDWLIWFLMLIRIVELHWIKTDVRTRLRVRNMRVGDLLDAILALGSLDNRLAPNEQIKQLLDDHFGKTPSIESKDKNHDQV